MNRVPALLGLLLALGVAPVRAQDSAEQAAQEFEFQAPREAGDAAATDAAMRDLAGRILPVYQDQDSERYLANLSALQLVAGDYTSANDTRQSLRERRQSAGEALGAQAVPLDLYAAAKALQTGDNKPPQQAFQQAFEALAPKLGDRELGVAEAWIEIPPSASMDMLQVSFDRLRDEGSLSFAEAMGLIWNYLALEVRRELGPQMPALAAADYGHRYEPGETVLRGRARGSEIEVRVQRPKAAAGGGGKRPALLEFGLDAPADRAAVAAAHGYVGVAAALRPARDGAAPLYPFEDAGADARKVIAWIVRQPWSDGRVAMYGAGYAGFAAWAAERALPPALKAIATADPMVPGIDFPAPGRIFQSAAYPWVLGGAAAADPARWREIEDRWYRSGKSYRALDQLAGLNNLSFLRWLDHPSYGPHWQKQVPQGWRFGRTAIPVLTVTGYYSADEPGALWYYGQHLRYRKNADHSLVIGPYRGGWGSRDGAIGPQPYPIDAGLPPDLDELRWQWLDHVLKNGPKPELLKDHVNYELMGSGTWRHAPSLEAAAATPQRLYLGAAHQLLPAAPAEAAPYEQSVDFRDRSDADRPLQGDGVIGVVPEVRNGLAYVSQPLPQPTELAGLLAGSLDLWINKQDVDLYLSAYELTAGGSYLRLCEPYRFRASYVRNPQFRRLLRAGERQTLEFHSERFCARRLETGSRLLLVLGVNKRPDQELNYGSGKDVDEESITDARQPLRIRWYPDSYVEVPLRNSAKTVP